MLPGIEHVDTDQTHRRGSPAEHSDRGRATPKIDEQMVANESIQRGSASPYGSIASPQEYSHLTLEPSSAYPESPNMYYNSLQPVTYSPQSPFATSPNFYPATTSGSYLTTSPASATSSGPSYSSYYPPIPTTQSNWPSATAESRDYLPMTGTYEQISDLPLESSSLNADIFQFCEPDNPQ